MKCIVDIDFDGGNVFVMVCVFIVGMCFIVYQGDEQIICEGEFVDEFGVIFYIVWQDFGFELGDFVVIGNVGVCEWDGKFELNIGVFLMVGVEFEMVEMFYDDCIGGEVDFIDL